jgi:hypothetical protein
MWLSQADLNLALPIFSKLLLELPDVGQGGFFVTAIAGIFLLFNDIKTKTLDL